MTVETTTKKVSYNGNGAAMSFSFSFVIYESTDLVVTKTSSDGVESPLSEGATDTTYSVTVSSYPGSGSITYPASGGTPLATGETITIKRVLPIKQTLDLENQGGYFPDNQERAFDKATMVDLQQQEDIDRSLKFGVSVSGVDATISGTPEANQIVKVNSDGDGFQFATATDLADFTAGASDEGKLPRVNSSGELVVSDVYVDAGGDMILGASAVRSGDAAKQIEIRGASSAVMFDDGTARRGFVGVDDGTPVFLTGLSDNDMIVRALSRDLVMKAARYIDLRGGDVTDDIMGYFTNANASSPYGMIMRFTGASPDNNTNYFFQFADSTTTRAVLKSDGDWQNHDNSYGAISDRTLKQDVAYVGPHANEDGTAKPVADGDGSYAALFKKFRPAKYRFKTDVEADENAGYQLGLIAQDVKEFAPGLVQGEGTEEVPYSLQYSLIAMQMVPAVQELIARVEALEAA